MKKDRVLPLIVTRVHGLGVENPKITALGCGRVVGGTHKNGCSAEGHGSFGKRGLEENAPADSHRYFAGPIFAAWEEET